MPTPSSTARASGAVTIRGLAPELKTRLRVRAAHNARSMEAEARAILEAALSAPQEDPTDLATFARALFAPLGGVELEPPPREPVRDPRISGWIWPQRPRRKIGRPSARRRRLPPSGGAGDHPSRAHGASLLATRDTDGLEGCDVALADPWRD